MITPLENGKIAAYALYASFDKSQAVRVEITLPFEIAKNIMLPIDARMVWKAAKKVELDIETGAQNLEGIPNPLLLLKKEAKGLLVLKILHR